MAQTVRLVRGGERIHMQDQQEGIAPYSLKSNPTYTETTEVAFGNRSKKGQHKFRIWETTNLLACGKSRTDTFTFRPPL